MTLKQTLSLGLLFVVMGMLASCGIMGIPQYQALQTSAATMSASVSDATATKLADDATITKAPRRINLSTTQCLQPLP